MYIQKYYKCTLPLKVSMVGDEQISRSIVFQMTRVAKRKEEEPKLVLDGVARKRCWS